MKRIIALIVLICCCCVYSAYSLVQPLSLTRTSGSGSGNGTRSVTDCSTIQINEAGITAVEFWSTYEDSANCHIYDVDSCNATNQGTYYFCSTDESLDNCLNYGLVDEGPAAYYNVAETPIPCKIGSVDGKNIVAFDYQMCDYLFEDFYEQFYDNRLDLDCYGQTRNVCYLMDSFNPKYYCTSSNNYELCGSNEFRYSYGGDFTEPCLIGTGGDYYPNYGTIPIVGFKKPIPACSEVFDSSSSLLNQLEADSSSISCSDNNNYNITSCDHNGITKYYCSGIYSGVTCPTNKQLIGVYYNDGLEACAIKYGSDPNDPAVIGFKSPNCDTIFNDEDLVNSLSTQSDVNCGSFDTASCLYNDVKRYYCQSGPLMLQDCPEGAESYYSTETPVPCTLETLNSIDKKVVGFKAGELCSTLLSYDQLLSMVPPGTYDDCPQVSWSHQCYTYDGIEIPICISNNAQLSLYNIALQDCPDGDWKTRPTETHTGACKTDILVEGQEDYLVGFVEPSATTIYCNAFVNPISGNFNFLSDDENFCGGFDTVACKAASDKKYLCYDNNVNVSDLPECAGNVYTGSVNAGYSYYSHSHYMTPCKTSNKYYDHWTVVGFQSNLCTYIVPGSSEDFFTRKDATYGECGNNSYLEHNDCSKQNEDRSGFCWLSGNKELPQCPTNPQPASLFREDLATHGMKNFPCDMNLTYNNKKVIAFAQLYSCDDRKNYFLEQEDVYTETLTQDEDPAELTKHACYIEGNDDFTYIYHVCTDMKKAEDCNTGTVFDPNNLCPYNNDYGKCKCSEGYMTVAQYKYEMGINNSETVVEGKGEPCTADGEDKYIEFNVVPLCEDIIENQNSLGEPGKEKDGWYVMCTNTNETACNTSEGKGSFVCRHCGADDATSNDYDFSKSFKINADNNPCLQGCHEDYACNYTNDQSDETITYCSQCNCSGYASVLELCSVGFEGEENDTEIMASPCYNFGKVDENESCKLSPIDNTLPTMYKKILCPDDYVTLEDWLGTSQTIITDNKFLGNNLNISNSHQWISYFVPQTDEGSVCDYAVEVVESGSGGTDVDSDIEDTNDSGNRSYSGGSDNLEGYEIKSLEAKYKGFNLSCQALVGTLPNLEFINQAYLHNYNDYTTCWDSEGNQEKYLATCHEDYLLPEEGYEVIGNEDVCKFNGKDYYKYGGSCPVIFSGKEAVVPESTSDDAIRTLYGSVKISPCNDNGTKKKVTYCDPNIYNQICEYPYVYAYEPTKMWCLRNVQGKAVDPSDTANNVKYYTNTGLPVQCKYVPKSCNSMLLEDGIANNVFIEDSPNDCIKKYGTAVQTKLCSGDNNIPKYACYYPKDTYKWTTQNCPIGRDLSRPYILINGVKYWDRCDCPPAYKYHVNNCRVYDLGGDTCEQEIDSHFIDTANDPTLPPPGGIIKLYTKCNDPQINQPNGCKTPLGTWAKCYYCCPKGTRATGNLSIDSCGAKIYECK